MADNYTRKVLLDFEADTDKAKRKIVDLQKSLSDLVVNTSGIDAFGNLDSGINSSIRDAAKLKAIIDDCVNPKTGDINLSKMSKEFDKAGLSVEGLKKSLHEVTGSDKIFNQLSQSVLSSKGQIVQLTGVVNDLWESLKRTAMWQLDSTIIHGFTGAMMDAYHYAEKLNKNLTDIRIVTGYSANKMADFAKEANNAAKALSTTTNEYVKGSLIFYQQGLSDEAVKERTSATIKLANTSGETAEQISSYMTAIWNNFEDGAHSVEYYADVISKLGAVSAASNADIAEGMQAFAATAQTVGLSYEYAASALTTLVDVTQQSASTVGNSLKTIFARLDSVKLGETLDDEVDLTKYTSALQTVGVNILKTNGDLKDMDEILDDLSTRWDTLSNSQKVAIAQTVGGVRQYNNLISLMDNYDVFKGFVDDSKESEGFLESQSQIYAESWEGAQNRVQASLESIYKSLVNDKFFIKLTNWLADFIDGIDKIVDGFGGLKGLIPALISGFSTLFGPKMIEGAKELYQNSAFTVKTRQKEDAKFRET